MITLTHLGVSWIFRVFKIRTKLKFIMENISYGCPFHLLVMIFYRCKIWVEWMSRHKYKHLARSLKLKFPWLVIYWFKFVFTQKHEGKNYLRRRKIQTSLQHHESGRKKSLPRLSKLSPDLRACNSWPFRLITLRINRQHPSRNEARPIWRGWLLSKIHAMKLKWNQAHVFSLHPDKVKCKSWTSSRRMRKRPMKQGLYFKWIFFEYSLG